jgi:hypothetical protein
MESIMEGLYIAPGISTPEIIFEPENTQLTFIGQSYPADTHEFYKPVFDWIEKFLQDENSKTGLNLIFKLKYYNTSSSKQFAKVFKMLEDSKIGSEVRVHWFYHDYDADMHEAGVRFRMFTNLKFEVKEYD